MNRRYFLLLAFVVVWLSCWLWATRYAMLDDALIHLRYAAWLNKLHIISYDGVHATFGTSSLLYVTLLAVLRSLTSSALLPKVVSVVCYVGLIANTMLLLRRMWHSRIARVLSIFLLVCLLSPMAIRWLTDGMETSLVLLTTFGLATITREQMNGSPLSPLRYAVLAGIGFCTVMLRIELASLVALASLAILAARFEAARKQGQHFRLFLQISHLCAGAVAAMLLVRFSFGTLLPDTALAKSGHPDPRVLVGAAHVIVSSFTFGMGILLLWVLSAWLAMRVASGPQKSREQILAWIAANLPFPLVLVLSVLRGQAIQGIRYLAWCLLFSAIWNIFRIETSEDSRSLHPIPLKLVVSGLAAFAICVLPFGWALGERAMAGRSQTFLAMRNSDLSKFAGQTVVAGDVGFVGYFSGAQICDIDGLVNGRDQARRSPQMRLAHCAESHPSALFVQSDQARQLNALIPIAQWSVCQKFDFRNVEGLDRHYLAVPPETASSECESIGGPIGPLQNFVPELRDDRRLATRNQVAAGS